MEVKSSWTTMEEEAEEHYLLTEGMLFCNHDSKHIRFCALLLCCCFELNEFALE